MRLFIAIELSEDIKTVLVDVQEQLRRASAPVTWAAPETLHLTVQFLGETEAALLPKIGAAISAAVAQTGGASFALRLNAVGAFPNTGRPSVVWVGVGGATTTLEMVQSAIATMLELLGFARETRPFHPHLTLGRVRREATAEEQAGLGTALRALVVPSLAWNVQRIVLFQSVLRRGGSVYTEKYALGLT